MKKYFLNFLQNLNNLKNEENFLIFDEFSAINKCLDKQI